MRGLIGGERRAWRQKGKWCNEGAGREESMSSVMGKVSLLEGKRMPFFKRGGEGEKKRFVKDSSLLH